MPERYIVTITADVKARDTRAFTKAVAALMADLVARGVDVTAAFAEPIPLIPRSRSRSRSRSEET